VGQGFVLPEQLPERLARTNVEMHGQEGAAWLGRLPGVVAGCARRWSLGLGPPLPGLSINYAAPGVRADGAGGEESIATSHQSAVDSGAGLC